MSRWIRSRRPGVGLRFHRAHLCAVRLLGAGQGGQGRGEGVPGEADGAVSGTAHPGGWRSTARPGASATVAAAVRHGPSCGATRRRTCACSPRWTPRSLSGAHRPPGRCLRRQYEVFGDERFVRLARLSNGHLYNLRKSRTYRCRRTVFTKTRARAVAIGERRKPRPDGQPGFVRVDTVHQGDLDGVKGVYYVNIVDEVTQYEPIGCVPALSERFLVPVLEALIRAYPFEIQGFHADNGSEYINHRVAALLNKLHIGQFTKSRAPPVQRQRLGRGQERRGDSHLPRLRPHPPALRRPSQHLHPRGAVAVSELPPPLPVRHRAARRQGTHPQVATATTTPPPPYEKLKSLPDAARWLKSGVTFETLDAVAYAQSDLDAALCRQRRSRRAVPRPGARVGPRRVAVPAPAGEPQGAGAHIAPVDLWTSPTDQSPID